MRNGQAARQAGFSLHRRREEPREREHCLVQIVRFVEWHHAHPDDPVGGRIDEHQQPRLARLTFCADGRLRETNHQVRVEQGRVIIEPVSLAYNLDELIAGISPDNVHAEQDFGPAQGGELLCWRRIYPMRGILSG